MLRRAVRTYPTNPRKRGVSARSVRPNRTVIAIIAYMYATYKRSSSGLVGTTTIGKLDKALVVEHHGRISGYATVIGMFAHAIGESNEDLNTRPPDLLY